jgi:hypothetical protein
MTNPKVIIPKDCKEKKIEENVLAPIIKYTTMNGDVHNKINNRLVKEANIIFLLKFINIFCCILSFFSEKIVLIFLGNSRISLNLLYFQEK